MEADTPILVLQMRYVVLLQKKKQIPSSLLYITTTAKENVSCSLKTKKNPKKSNTPKSHFISLGLGLKFLKQGKDHIFRHLFLQPMVSFSK